MAANKFDKNPRRPRSLRSSDTERESLHRQPKKKHRNSALLWWRVGRAGVVSAVAGTLLAFSLTSAPLQQHALSDRDIAFFNPDGKQVFARNALQISEINKPVNILVLGIKTNLSDLKNSDGSQRKKTGYDAEIDSLDGLSDTMMLIRFDPQSQRIVVFGIPRDTRIERSQYGIEKINAVDKESGVTIAAQEVSKVLGGVPIDRYIRVNNIGVNKLIDSLGGVTVTIPKDIKYQDDSQHFYVNLKAGKQHLDGQGLMNFLRYRHDANGDIGRMQRQQVVMQALSEQALNPVNVARIPELLSIVKSHIDTNLTGEEILALGGFSLHTGKSKMQMLLMPGDYNGDGKHGVSFWLPDKQGIQNMMARYFDRGTVAIKSTKPENIRINIQDTTYFPDTTKRLIKKLHRAGYQNVHIDNTLKLKEDLATSQIIAQKGNPQIAEGLTQSLGFGEIKIETSGVIYSDLTIKLGHDWIQKEQEYRLSGKK